MDGAWMRPDALEIEQSAKAYAQRGWYVIPVIPREKRPVLRDWGNRATRDLMLIEAWYRNNVGWGVGILSGRKSGLVIIDIDGQLGADTWADLCAQFGPPPDTVEVVTGSGGRHLYYKFPSAPYGEQEITITNDAGGRLGPGIDVRAEGGFVVAPPTVHPNGNPYQWEAMSSPFDGVAVAELPGWLLRLLTKGPIGLAPRDDSNDRSNRAEDRPGDRYMRTTAWRDLLLADGATFMGTRTDHRSNATYEVWARPGVQDHISATLYYGGSDVLKVFTTNWPGLVPNATYTKFGYFAATRFADDYSAAARALRGREEEGLGGLPATIGLPPADDAARAEWEASRTLVGAAEPPEDAPGAEAEAGGVLRRQEISWPDFWRQSFNDAQWHASPMFPIARAVALHAGGKTGKSFLVLDGAASLATGRMVFGQPATAAIAVGYVDFEMGPGDLYDRLTALGYGEADDLSNLHYLSLPSLAPLDSAEGGRLLAEWALDHGLQVLVIDTLARAVEGDENEADTVRRYYRHTGVLLKQHAVTAIRLDHSGKDAKKGQRGSSAKNDDVDVVFELIRMSGMLRLRRTHSRVPWVPEQSDFVIMNDPVRHIITNSDTELAPFDVVQIADLLDDYGLPPDASVRMCQHALAEIGQGRSASVITHAVRLRKHRNSESIVNRLGGLGAEPETP